MYTNKIDIKESLNQDVGVRLVKGPYAIFL